VSVIIDRTGLNDTFSRMVDPALRQRDGLLDDPVHETLRRTLAGDRVPIAERRAHPLNREGGFTVMRLERIAGTDIDLYGVCFTDRQSRAELQQRLLIDADSITYDLLGDARADAADRNSTAVRRTFGQYLQHAATNTAPLASLAVTDLLAAPAQKQTPALKTGAVTLN
jgi:hypothetical protein